MQYKVPQNIDIEDKIVGPFTMKQFVYLLVGAFIIYGIYNYLSKGYDNFMPLFIILALPIGLIAFAFVFVKINDRPFEQFIANLILFMKTPKKRIWSEGYKGEDVIVDDPTVENKDDEKRKDNRSLDDIAKSLEAKTKTLPHNQQQSQSGEGSKIENLSLAQAPKEENATTAK